MIALYLKEGDAVPWFFTDCEAVSESVLLTGDTARHISKSLRMRIGEELTLVTPSGEQLECRISDSGESVLAEIISRKKCQNEPACEVTLFQALPKGDKMELIIQKSVELGVAKIVPVLSARCVSRPDEKSLAKKRVRWQKIALEAAQQSRRGKIPEICEAVSFKQAVELSSQNDRTILFYELGGDCVRSVISDKPLKIGIFIGCEGGFEPSEAELVLQNGGHTATLGKRILRAETAPLAALSAIMYEMGEFDLDPKTVKEFEYDRNNLCSGN